VTRSERTTTDGVALHTRHWPAHGAARATVVLVHGIAEHGGRYEHVGSALAEAGFETRATDLRGFGESGGVRGYVHSFDDYLTDLQADVEAARGQGLPTVLLGHSMGGLIALLYLIGGRTRPHLGVLSAPALEADVPLIKRAAARILSRVAPRLALANDLDGSQLSRDAAVGKAYFADPLVHAKTTARLGAELLAAMKRAREGAARIEIPTLVIHGGADTIVPPAATAALADLPGVERRLFPAFRHESFNEEGGAAATSAVVDWVSGKL